MPDRHFDSFDPAENLVFRGVDVAEFAHEIPVPDALDLVVEVGAMMAIHSAALFERVDGMRREALHDAALHGHQLSGVIERSLRLELASALGVTEAWAAG